MTFFWILWCLVAAITAAAVFWFFHGLRLADQGSKYYSSWAKLLAYLAITLASSPWLAQHGLARVAWALLSIPSVIVLGYLLVLGVLVAGRASWR